MPRVESYGDQRVQERPALRANVTTQATPEAFGAAAARGLGAVADGVATAADAAERLGQLVAATNVRQRDVENAEKLRALRYDPDKGFLNQQGQNAVNGAKDYEAAVRKIFSDGGLGLSKAELPAYNRVSEARIQDALQDGIIHASQQQKVVIADGFKARTSSLAADAVAKHLDPTAVLANIAAAKNELRQRGQLEGWSTDAIAEEERQLEVAIRKDVAARSVTHFEGQLETFTSSAYEDPAAQDVAVTTFERQIDASVMPDEVKEQMKRSGARQIRNAAATRLRDEDPSFVQSNVGISAPPRVTSPGDPSLPAGMRNNNPGNIKYVGQGRNQGVLGPSKNTDQGDPQAVFESPEAGMAAAYRLALKKYDGGKTTANDLIAGQGGWTPGNRQAAANIAASMGLKPDEDLNLKDPARAAAFLRGLVRQEHGKASDAYSDGMIQTAISAVSTGASVLADASPALAGSVEVAKMLLGATEGRDFKAISTFIERAAGVKIDPRQTAWCAYFVNAVLGSQGVEGTGSGMARSFLNYGTETDKPEPGDLAVFARGNDPSKGHVGIIASVNADGSFEMVSGNSSQAVSITRHRADEVLGFRRPPDASSHDKADEMLRSLPGGGPEGGLHVTALDPRFAKLPLEDRMRLANQSQQLIDQRAAHAKAQQKLMYDSYKDSFSLRLATGDMTEAQILTDGTLNDGDKATLLRTFRSDQNEEARTRSDVRAYLNGSLGSLNPLDPDETKRANKLFKTLNTEMKDAPPEVRAAETRRFIRDTSIIPTSVEATIRGAAMSEKPSEVESAMITAADIEGAAPLAFKTLPQDFRADYAEYKELTTSRGLTGKAASALIVQRRKEGDNSEAVWGKLADKFVTDNVRIADALESFGGLFGFGAPGDGATPREENQLIVEYRDLAREEFIKSKGDPSTAKARAAARLADTWGISNISGKAELAKFPPEKFYPPVNGTFDYIRSDALATVKEAVGADADNVFLVADGATARDIDAKRSPSYSLIYTTAADGPTTFHFAPMRWAIPVENLRTLQQGERDRKQAEFDQADSAVSADRQNFQDAQAAGRAAFDQTVGPDWMKSRAMDIAREGVRQNRRR